MFEEKGAPARDGETEKGSFAMPAITLTLEIMPGFPSAMAESEHSRNEEEL